MVGQFLASVGDTCRVAMGGRKHFLLLRKLTAATRAVSNTHCEQSVIRAQFTLYTIHIASNCCAHPILWKIAILKTEAILIVNNCVESKQKSTWEWSRAQFVFSEGKLNSV